MKKIFLLAFLTLASLLSFAQKTDIWFKDQAGNLTECKRLILQTDADGNVVVLQYITLTGENKKFSGKDKCPYVSAYKVNGVVNHYLPVNPKKPDGEKKFMELAVDGKLKVYHKGGNRDYAPTNGSLTQKEELFIIEFEDGSRYNVLDKKDFKNDIVPKLSSCVAFITKQKGAISNDYKAFVESVTTYNESCK